MGSHYATRELLEYLRIGYPILLLLVFVSSFVANSIVTARNVSKNQSAARMGPGGRPLPKRSRSSATFVKPVQPFSRNAKLLFKWLSVVVLATLVADAAINVTHVMLARSEQWWCGQAVVVSCSRPCLHPWFGCAETPRCVGLLFPFGFEIGRANMHPRRSIL